MSMTLKVRSLSRCRTYFTAMHPRLIMSFHNVTSLHCATALGVGHPIEVAA